MATHKIIIVVWFVVGTPAISQEVRTVPAEVLSPEIVKYVDAAIDTLKLVSRHRGLVNWQSLRDSALTFAAGAKKPRDVYPVVDWLLSRVDGHSFLQANWFGVRGEIIRECVGYIRVPFYSGGMSAILADTLQSILASHVSQGVSRWIVDLRNNGGGNVWPMLAGIGPLLGDSVVAWDQSPTGLSLKVYSNGAAMFVEEDGTLTELVRVTTNPLIIPPPLPPVAVLIDRGTASSAEAIAVCFRSRPSTRFFGERTAGVSSTNKGYRLPDGANMVITIGVYADRHGNLYPDGIGPHETIASSLRGPTMLVGDPVVARAVRWLEEFGSCAK